MESPLKITHPPRLVIYFVLVMNSDKTVYNQSVSVVYSKGRAEWTIIAQCEVITKNIKEAEWLGTQPNKNSVKESEGKYSLKAHLKPFA